MSDLRKEVKQALDEGEIYDSYGARWGQKRIEALRAALAQPEPEPVAWMKPTPQGRNIAISKDSLDAIDPAYQWMRDNWSDATPLYTAPPQRKSLTKEQTIEAIKHISHNEMSAFSIAKAIEEAHGIE